MNRISIIKSMTRLELWNAYKKQYKNKYLEFYWSGARRGTIDQFQRALIKSSYTPLLRIGNVYKIYNKYIPNVVYIGSTFKHIWQCLYEHKCNIRPTYTDINKILATDYDDISNTFIGNIIIEPVAEYGCYFNSDLKKCESIRLVNKIINIRPQLLATPSEAADEWINNQAYVQCF